MKRFNLISASNKDSGFTLIEILIAITLLAFISIGVISVVQNAGNTMERTTEINKNNLQVETALSRFEWDFSQIYSPTYFSQVMDLKSRTAMPGEQQYDENGNPITPTTTPIPPELSEYYQRLLSRFEGSDHFWAITNDGTPVPSFYAPEKTTFEFFTSSNRRKLENTKQSHFAWVRYTLGPAIERGSDFEQNPNIPPSLKTLVRYFSADDPFGPRRLDPNNNNGIKGSVLLENVESLEFQFWDMKRKKWENNLKTIESGEHIIRGVKLLITWYDSAGLKRSVSRVYRNFWPMLLPQDPAPSRNNTTPPPQTPDPDPEEPEE